MTEVEAFQALHTPELPHCYFRQKSLGVLSRTITGYCVSKSIEHPDNQLDVNLRLQLMQPYIHPWFISTMLRCASNIIFAHPVFANKRHGSRRNSPQPSLKLGEKGICLEVIESVCLQERLVPCTHYIHKRNISKAVNNQHADAMTSILNERMEKTTSNERVMLSPHTFMIDINYGSHTHASQMPRLTPQYKTIPPYLRM